VRGIGWTFAIATALIWIALRALLPSADGLLVSVRLPWVPDLGISLHLGLDNTGALLAGMIALVGVAAVVGTLPPLPEIDRSYIVCLLLAETGMLGVLSAWDLMVFITFWEVTLVPFFILMSRGPMRGEVVEATRFFVTSVASDVIMWVGVLWVVNRVDTPTFDLLELSARLAGTDIASNPWAWLFVPAFLMRMAAFPLHTWFPAAQSIVPTAAGILLAGGVLPLGGFGIIHVLTPLFGLEQGVVGPWLVIIGLATALGGGLMAPVQRDLKRLLAYTCLAQTGLALAGLTLPAGSGSYGGLLLLLAAGLGGAALFLFAGVICKARDSQRIVEISGLWRSHPTFAGMGFAAAASVAALPGTIGFIGSYLVLEAVSDNIALAALSALAMLLIGIAVLSVFLRITKGSYQEEFWSTERWPSKRQFGILLLLMLSIFATGIMPGLVAPSSLSKLSPMAKTATLSDTLKGHIP
jgi:NADH-quinone oxidoreductase subunit M